MVILSTHKHTQAILRWYFLEQPYGIVRGYAAYGRALMEIFPLPFLMLTLIAPWKNIRERKKGHGFNIQEWFERLGFNIFSRTVGAVVRIIAMVLGVCLHIALFVFSVAYLLLWVTFPAVTVAVLTVLIRQL